MTKIVLTDLANLQNETTAVNAINSNNAVLETASDNTLSRDGTSPNQMLASLDMNSNKIINLPAATTSTEPVRKTEFDAAVFGTPVVPTIAGTANEITASTVGFTTTVSLPAALTMTGKTQTGGTYTNATINGNGSINTSGNGTVNNLTANGTSTLTGNVTANATNNFGGTNTINNAALTGTPTAPTQSPGDNTTKVATTAFVLANSGATGVTSIAGNAGAFTLGTGLTNTGNVLKISPRLGYMAGLQPLSLTSVTSGLMGLNPGSWISSDGNTMYSTSSVLTAQLQSSVPDFTVTPALGAMVSGGLTLASTADNGQQVNLWLCHRNSDSKVVLVGSSSDVYGALLNFDNTASSQIINFHAPHGLFVGNQISFTSSGTLPNPLTAGTKYYVVAANFGIGTISVATSRGGSAITLTNTGSGVHTGHWGVQNDLDLQLGAGVATVDRGIHFGFRWNNNWSGIPNFNSDLQPGGGRILLTGAQNSFWKVLNAGTSASFARIDLSPWLNNANRIVYLTTYTTGTAGTAYLDPTGSLGGEAVGEATGTGGVWNNYEIQTDSTSSIYYKTTGGANLTLFIAGWTFVDPR